MIGVVEENYSVSYFFKKILPSPSCAELDLELRAWTSCLNFSFTKKKEKETSKDCR